MKQFKEGILFQLLTKLFQVKKEKKAQGSFSSTYVIGTSINDPRSLVLNWDLISTKYGVFITNSEHYNLVVAYVDLSKVLAGEKQNVAEEFLRSLRAEVFETGSVSMRIINAVKGYQV